MKEITKHVLEVRFDPQGEILDKRGKIATSLRHDLFEHWRISSNGVNFFSDKNKMVSAYFSFQNIGFISQSPNSKDFFIKEVKNFINKAWEHIPTKITTRLGLRSLYFIESSDEFETILEKLATANLNPKIEKFKQFGDLIDIGISLNFKKDIEPGSSPISN